MLFSSLASITFLFICIYILYPLVFMFIICRDIWFIHLMWHGSLLFGVFYICILSPMGACHVCLFL